MSAYQFRQLTPDDMEQLIDVRSASYGPMGDREQATKVLLTRLPYSLGAFKDGRLRSVTIMLPLAAYLAGREVTIGGLNGVATSPESRRGGLVAQGMGRWFEDLRGRGIGWSAEHPFEPSFYARYGYQTVLNGHTLELPLGELRSSVGDARSIDVEAEPLNVEAVERFKPIYSGFAQRYSFMLRRDDGVKDHWPSIFQRSWEPAPRLAFLLEDAYLILTTEDDPHNEGRDRLEVRDFAYTSPAGRQRLLALLTRFEGQATTVRLHVPPGDAIALDRVAYRTAKAPELQLRVVDLASALGVLRWSQPTSIRLQVEDAQCPWNDGNFDIEVGPHGAAVSRSHAGSPEASLDIAALAALVTAAATPETLIADGRATGSTAKLRGLCGALSSHPIFKPESDHF